MLHHDPLLQAELTNARHLKNRHYSVPAYRESGDRSKCTYIGKFTDVLVIATRSLLLLALCDSRGTVALCPTWGRYWHVVVSTCWSMVAQVPTAHGPFLSTPWGVLRLQGTQTLLKSRRPTRARGLKDTRCCPKVLQELLDALHSPDTSLNLEMQFLLLRAALSTPPSSMPQADSGAGPRREDGRVPATSRARQNGS